MVWKTCLDLMICLIWDWWNSWGFYFKSRQNCWSGLCWRFHLITWLENSQKEDARDYGKNRSAKYCIKMGCCCSLSVPWSNSLWHLDGHHSSILWKFVIHVCIDGFLWQIMFLRCSSNNLAETVLCLFLHAMRNEGGTLAIQKKSWQRWHQWLSWLSIRLSCSRLRVRTPEEKVLPS